MKHTESRLRVKLQGNDFSDVKAYLLSTSDNHPQSAVWNIYKNNFSNYPTDESVASAAITTTDYTFSFPVSSCYSKDIATSALHKYGCNTTHMLRSHSYQEEGQC